MDFGYDTVDTNKGRGAPTIWILDGFIQWFLVLKVLDPIIFTLLIILTWMDNINK